MTLTTHAAIGMLVAQTTNDPLLGFGLALASHYVADAVPHGDEFIYWRHVHNPRDTFTYMVAATDLFVLILIVLAAVNYRNPDQAGLLVAATIGGILPDLGMTLHTKMRERLGPKTAGRGWVSTTYRLLDRHNTFHRFCHDLMRTPMRFRTAIFLQAVFLSGFVYFFIG
jgi:hypothetical protein